jgi:hypothetical protein
MGHLKEYYDAMTCYELTEDTDIETIICAVEETINIKELDVNTNYESIKIAFDNASYYIEDDCAQFYFDEHRQELRDAARKIVKENSFDQEEFVWWIQNVLELIHQVFNEDYFLNRMVHLRRSKTSGCKAKLRTALYKLNMEQLKEYYQLISYGVEKFHWFVNELDWELMYYNLHSESYKREMEDCLLNEFEDSSSPLSFLNYIDKEKIAETLFDSIEYHTFIAENTAEILYDFGYDDAFMYLNTAT